MPSFEAAAIPGNTVSELGDGGQSIVEEVELHGRKLARKRLKPGFVTNAEQIKRIRQEITILSDLRHPNIVKIESHGEYLFHPGGVPAPYYLMSLGQGTMEEKRPEGTELSDSDFNQLLNYFWELLVGVSYCHSRDVVHRDLKPSNALIVDGGAKVSDFGYGKRPDKSDGLTRTGYSAGTRGFMAPEQHGGSHFQEASKAMDVYSLGAILYWILTGCTPDPFGSSVCEGIENLPEGVESLLLKCLSLKPSDRFVDAIELRNAFFAAVKRQSLRDARWQLYMKDPAQDLRGFLALYDNNDETAFAFVNKAYKTCVSVGRGNIYEYFDSDLINRLLFSDRAREFVDMIFEFDKKVFHSESSWSTLGSVGKFYSIVIGKLFDLRQRTFLYEDDFLEWCAQSIVALSRSYLERVLFFRDFEGGRYFVRFFAKRGAEVDLLREVLASNNEAAQFVGREVRRQWIEVDSAVDRLLNEYR